jgi:lipopolysaccharide transport system permease protein
MKTPGKTTLSHLQNFWNYREFLLSLTIRNLKAKYQRSIFGFLWTLLNPLLSVGVLTVVFSRIVRIPMEHYWAFLFSGYFVWNCIHQTISSSTYVLVEHAQLSRSIAYPKEAPVLAAAFSRFIEFLFEMFLVLILVSLFHHRGLPASYVYLPWIMSVQFLVMIGFMLPVAALSVFFNDIHHGLPIVLWTLFYVTPIFYPLSMVGEPLRRYIWLNPFTGLLAMYQRVIYEGAAPSLMLCCGMTIFSLLLAWLGYGIFNRHKEIYAEIL